MAAWLAPLFASLAAFFGQWMAKKTMIVTSFVAGSLALTTAFVVAVKALLAGIVAQLPSWAVGVGYFVPDNAALCLSAVLTAKIARWIYDYHFGVLKTAAGAG